MPEQQETIIILTPAFPADESDTAWVPPKQLFVKKLKDSFPSLNIIVLSFNYPYHTEKYLWHNVEVIAFNGMQARKINRLLLWRRVWKQLSKINKQQHVIGILSFWCGETALTGRYFAKRHNIPHFCWISGMDAKKNNRLIKLIRPSANELVAMSVFLAKEFYKNHSVKPQHIIPIGIDTSEFSGTTQSRDIDIMGAGFFNPLKQYDVFIRVVKKLSESFPRIKVVLCGKGTEKERIEGLIKELQLENNITLPGVLPHDEVLKLMQRTRVFLHPSLYEGFGAVCIEALYAGAQVISVCNPMEETIAHWHYVTTEDEMTDKALELLQSPATPHKPVLTYKMEDSARAMMKLFAPDNKSRAIEQNLSYYNEVADNYNNIMQEQHSNQLVRQKVKEKFTSLIQAGSVLDFGGGTGLDLEWLTAANYNIIFCEPSAMREKAIQYNNATLHNKSIIFLDAANSDFTKWHMELPFQQKVDGILCNFGVINYIPDISLLFGRLSQVIKPGGHIVILVLKFNLKKRLKWHRRNAIHSLLSGKTFVMYIPFKEQLQHVFVYTRRKILKTSSPWFDDGGEELMTENDFTLIHLIRNETH